MQAPTSATRRPGLILSTALVALAAGSALDAQTFTSFGSGCGTVPASPPSLSGSGNHKIGGSSTIQAVNLPTSQPAALYLGFSNTLWFGGVPLPFDLTPLGAFGCSQLVSTEIALPFITSTAGHLQLTLNHPLNANFVGLKLYIQAVAIDPAAAGRLQIAMTDGGELTIGAACSNGPQSGFSLAMPPMTTYVVPTLTAAPLTLNATYSGTKQRVCCNGPASQTSGCRLQGTATYAGSLPPFTLAPHPLLNGAITGPLCAAVSAVTFGTVNCQVNATVHVNGISINAPLAVSSDQCSGTTTYSGTGTVTVGTVTVGGTASVTVDLGRLGTHTIGVVLTGSGQGSGSLSISNNRMSVTAGVSSVRVQAGFLVPVINKFVGINLSAPTPYFTGTGPSVPLPLALPFGC